MIDRHVLYHKSTRNRYCINPFAFGILDLESTCTILPQYSKALAKLMLLYQIRRLEWLNRPHILHSYNHKS